MRISIRNALASFCLLLLLLGAAHTQGCGLGSSSITNLPDNEGSGFQVNALNAGGQLTGCFYPTGQSAAQAFMYGGGVLTDLGTLGGAYSQGFAINLSGQVAGESALSAGTGTNSFLYNGRSLVALGTLGGTYNSPTAINGAGQVAGYSLLTGDSAYAAYLYANGAITNLGTLGGDYSAAFALNNSGEVAGESSLANGDVHGFAFSGGAMLDLGTLGGNYSSAFALNNSGVIVGNSTLANGQTHAFIYSGGVMTDAGTLGGTSSSCMNVNDAGQLIGTSTTADGQTHGFIYNGSSMLDLGTLGGGFASPMAINNLGQVVGESTLTNGDYHAFLWQNGNMVDLNTLLPTNSGWELLMAQFLNDSGRIVGLGTDEGLLQWFILDLPGSNVPPVAVAGPDQTVACQSEVTLDGSHSTSSDGGVLTYQWSAAGYVLGTNAMLTGTFALGTNVVTLKVTDVCGLSAQTNVVVLVTDTVPPTITGPTAITASSGANCQAPVPNVLSQAVASDNCTPRDALILGQTPAAGTLVGLGQHVITLTATDEAGNSASCSTLFTVVDTTPPTILSLPAPVTVSVADNCQGTVPNLLSNVVATDGCTPANQLVMTQTPAAGTTLGLGLHSITIMVTDGSGNSSTGSVVLTVVDTTPPTILSSPASLTVSADDHCQGAVPNVLAMVVASDNCTSSNELVLTQTPAAGTLLGDGQYTIMITVTDASGNTTSRIIPFTIADTTPPVMHSLDAEPKVLWPPNHKAVPVKVSVKASDNCDAAPVSKIIAITANERTAPGDIRITGDLTALLAASRDPKRGERVYTITVQCTDASGNGSTAEVKVTVPRDEDKKKRH